MNTEKLLSELSKPVVWPNGCNETAVNALRYLAENKRPIGGSDMYNTEHLYMIASELTRIANKPLYSQEYVSALRADAAKWFEAFEKAVSVGARYEERIAELEERLALVREQRDNELRTNSELEKLLATPVRLHPQGDAAMTSNKQLIELKAAADKYSLTLKAHRENPRDANALVAWDLATSEFCDLTNNNEASIIIDLLAALEEAQKESVYFCNLNARKNERIAELERARFIAWTGNMFAPVLARIKVDVKRRDGSVSVGLSGGNVVWYHQNRHDDVVAFALSVESDA